MYLAAMAEEVKAVTAAAAALIPDEDAREEGK